MTGQPPVHESLVVQGRRRVLAGRDRLGEVCLRQFGVEAPHLLGRDLERLQSLDLGARLRLAGRPETGFHELGVDGVQPCRQLVHVSLGFHDRRRLQAEPGLYRRDLGLDAGQPPFGVEHIVQRSQLTEECLSDGGQVCRRLRRGWVRLKLPPVPAGLLLGGQGQLERSVGRATGTQCRPDPGRPVRGQHGCPVDGDPGLPAVENVQRGAGRVPAFLPLVHVLL